MVASPFSRTFVAIGESGCHCFLRKYHSNIHATCLDCKVIICGILQGVETMSHFFSPVNEDVWRNNRKSFWAIIFFETFRHESEEDTELNQSLRALWESDWLIFELESKYPKEDLWKFATGNCGKNWPEKNKRFFEDTYFALFLMGPGFWAIDKIKFAERSWLISMMMTEA